MNHPRNSLPILVLMSTALAVGCHDDSKTQPMRSLSESAPTMKAAGLESPPTLKGQRAGEETARAVTAEARTGVASEPESPKTPTPRAASPAGGDAVGFRVKRLVLTRGIENKEPVETVDFKPDGSAVYAFVELENAAATDETIEIVFEHESGHQVGFVKLEVPAEHERWRTWGRTRQIKQSGNWVAVVRNASGQELMRQGFTVEAS